jgi:hypothetical protein
MLIFPTDDMLVFGKIQENVPCRSCGYVYVVLLTKYHVINPNSPCGDRGIRIVPP